MRYILQNLTFFYHIVLFVMDIDFFSSTGIINFLSTMNNLRLKYLDV